MGTRVETVVVGGGQAGLATGYHLARRGRPFVILDAQQRVGDAWRHRWDSLRLFTPARFDSLPGDTFPAARWEFPTKDEFADYLESYAERFELPVLTGHRVERLSAGTDGFVLTAGGREFEADNVVVAMSGHQRPRVPEFAAELDDRIVQLHSSAYRNPGQLAAGDVLLAGAGNSGSEIAMELAGSHRVWMAGRDTGHLPFHVHSRVGHMLAPIVLRLVFHRLLTVRTPIGRRVRPRVISGGAPLIRVKPRALAAAGVIRGPRVTGVDSGMPVLEDGQRLDVRNVVWCTGYRPDDEWLDLPDLDDPTRNAGASAEYPGLYFVGPHFLYSLSSEMIHGSARDAERAADLIARSPQVLAAATQVAGPTGPAAPGSTRPGRAGTGSGHASGSPGPARTRPTRAG